MEIGFLLNLPFSMTIQEALAESQPYLEAIAEYTEGATAVPGAGYWKPTDEFEWSIRVSAECAEDRAEALFTAVTAMAVKWGTETSQHSVALIRNGELLIIPLMVD